MISESCRVYLCVSPIFWLEQKAFSPYIIFPSSIFFKPLHIVLGLFSSLRSFCHFVSFFLRSELIEILLYFLLLSSIHHSFFFTRKSLKITFKTSLPLQFVFYKHYSIGHQFLAHLIKIRSSFISKKFVLLLQLQFLKEI